LIRIIVCAKVIIDPEMPPSAFKVDSEAMKPIPPEGMPPVISPFDERALEAALKIKDQQTCRVTVLSVGNRLPKPVLQRVLAVGADEVIAIEGPEFENLDPYNTAQVLANAIKKLGDYDIVFTGRQAGDWDAGLVWAGVAESLDLPSITIARKAQVSNDKLTVERCVTDGIEILESDMPALVTFSSEVGELRYFSLQALIKVRRQEIPRWSASDVEFKKSSLMGIRDLYKPDIGQVDCDLATGQSGEEKGRNLAKKLMDEGIILGTM
jgi:electron transfer flavoprotein beta subunit